MSNQFTGFHDAWNRTYSATWGRFTSADPYVMSGGLGNPQGWNRYAYVQGDPVNFHDPAGRMIQAPFCYWGPIMQAGPEGWGFTMWQGLVCDDWGGGGGGIEAEPLDDPLLSRWAGLSDDCKTGLSDALPVGSKTSPTAAARVRLDALDRAIKAKDTLSTAVDGTNIGWAMLAAIGIRETGFRNRNQAGGNGVGIFQIDTGQNPSVTAKQASDLAWAAKWAANTLDTNSTKLAKDFPDFDAAHLLQATAASWNLGVGGITGNPETIDFGSTRNNYGSNIVNLMDCFR